MSTVKWYKQKIYCETESAWQYDITESETLVTACPNNNTHTCRSGSASIVNFLSSNLVKIQEEASYSDTNGFYTARGRAFTVPGNTTIYDAFLPKIPISILRGHFFSRPELEGDVITAYVLPQSSTLVGYATANANDGDTVIHVSFSVLMMVEVNKLARVYFREVATGRETTKYTISEISLGAGTATLSEPLNTEDGNALRAAYGVYIYLDTNIVGVMTTSNTVNSTWINIVSPAMGEIKRGRYLNLFRHNQEYSQERMIEVVDLVNSRVKIVEPFNIAMTPSNEAPVYIQLNIRTVNEIELDGNNIIDVGAGTIGGSYIGTNVVLCLVYKRNSNTPARIRYNYELLY